jgi:lysyl-tRNA synthetase class 2
MTAEQQRLARLKDNLARRAQVFELTRRFFQERGFLELETPQRVPAIAPEANIVPLMSEDWYLITSPELHMKRLLAAGYERIFQIAAAFAARAAGCTIPNSACWSGIAPVPITTTLSKTPNS